MAIFAVSSSVPQVVFRGTLDFASVAAGNMADQTVTVKGVLPDMMVAIAPEASLTAGIFVVSVIVTAKDTLTVRFYNITGDAIDLASQIWRVVAF